MSKAEVDPVSASAAEDDEPARDKKKGKLLTAAGRHVAVRVLSYAHPYRGKIFFGLLVSVFAGFFGAANILALLPALQIMLEPEKREERVSDLRHTIHKLEIKIAENTGTDFTAYKRALSLKGEFHRKRLQLALTEFMVDEREEAVFWIVGIVVLMQITKAFLEFIAKFQLARAFIFSTNRIRMELYNRALSLDLAHFHSNTSGELIGRLNNDIRQVKQIFGTMIGQALTEPVKVVFLFVLLIVLNPKLTLITAAAIPLVIVPISLLGKKIRKMGKADESEDVKLIDLVSETITSLSIVKAFSAEEFERKRFRNTARAITRRQIRREMLRMLADPAVETVTMMAMGTVICIGAYLILKSSEADMTAAEFIAYVIALSQFYRPLKSVSGAYVKAQRALASAERVFEIIDKIPEIQDGPNAVDIPKLQTGVTFEDVRFTYVEGRDPALKGVSLTIPRGKRIALVGKSGSGKTTLARLVPRFYDPTSGTIRFDGVDIRDAKIESVRSQIAYVTQDTMLFNESIEYNILYGRPDATPEELVAAATAANAHGFISELPEGYETQLGERGGQLSGGQRQRVAIARAILRNAPILILDEATSALDNESEAVVNEALERLMEGRTTLVIAHRLSTVRQADEIVVMNDGVVVERGRHDELIALNGKYAELCAIAELREN
jgi:subfamily B ATP-binding cassette protein MsbA